MFKNWICICVGLKTAKQQTIKTAEFVAEKTYIYTDQVAKHFSFP